MINKDYFLGLDIGTDSVGFAVTDDRYNVINKGKKPIIGVRLFENGLTAEERRGFRSARRRTQRKKDRINFLRELFNDEICKIDTAFFKRFDESMYHYEDKSIKEKHTLFNDKSFNDKNYYIKYPTVYHLRKALINKEIDDVRLLYLGIAHIIKNRGHFLFQGVQFGNITDFSSVFNNLKVLLNSDYEEYSLNILDENKLEIILKDSTKGITAKEKEIYSILQEKPEAEQKSLIKLMVGGSVKISKLFENADEEIANKSISFKGDYEKLYEEIAPALDENIILIDMLKAIYDWSVLIDVLDCPGDKVGAVTLSDAKIHKYKTHEENLKLLKKAVKDYIPSEYKDIFVNSNLKNNYPAYIGMTKTNNKKVPLTEKVCSEEDFCKFVLSKFKDVETESAGFEFFELFNKMKLYSAFPKQRTKDNSVIPYQVHEKELDLILENNSDKFKFLLSSDGEHTVKDKIKSIFLYRIPYYVGPLNENSNFSWVVKNLQEEIYPWNFEKVVNKEESAEKFIANLTNKCTYLRDKDVIPQKSLLYSKFTVLNELNNLKLNGQPITVELKQEIYNNLFKQNKKITQKKLKSYLVKNCYCDKDVQLSGIDGDFKASLESYIDFVAILGENFDENMAEDIIKWIVLFSEEKSMLKCKIKSKYTLSSDVLNRIVKLKYSGWGRLSKEFLTEVYDIDKTTGEIKKNIIDTMYDTNYNLMQLLSNEFNYINVINNNRQAKSNIELTDVKELYCSPAVKKSIWQAVQITKEIEHVMGTKPLKLFVEVTRAEGEKVRTTSRKNELLKTYNTFKKEYAEIYNTLEGKSESELRQKKLYLYFTQLGRCAYTGRAIDLESLNSSTFDIEHIYPRSKTKDDSIHNNLVLVYKTANEDKSDTYPIPQKYRQEELWKLWFEKGLINKTKFDRLMRRDEFEPKELEGFIARQLVETSQASKAVAQLFESYYEGTSSKVVYVKAGNVSDFRRHFDIVKVREVNDYHHAHDAYLNIVVGNVWDTKFTNKFYLKNANYSLKPEILYPTSSEKHGEYAWDKGENGTIAIVKNTVEKSKVLFTRHSFKASGALFDQTIYKKGEGEFAVKNPLDKSVQYNKLTDLSKYGGFKSIKGAYFCVVEHLQKKKLVRTIEYVPIYLASQIEHNPVLLDEYLKNKLKLFEHKIIFRELKYGALLNVDGFPMHISGRTNVQLVFKGAVQLNLSVKDMHYFKKLVKAANNLKTNSNYKISVLDKITKEDNLHCYNLLIDKLRNSIYKIRLETQADTLVDKKNVFAQKSLEIQCRVLVNILNMFRCNASKTDLSMIEGPANVGTILISKKISDRNSIKLINQSITGLYENSTDLLK